MIFRFSKLWVIFAILSVECEASSDLPSCLDEEGNQVDWFIAYKFPMMSDQPEPFNSGLSYAYLTNKISDQDDIDIHEISDNREHNKAMTVLDHIRSLFGYARASPKSESLSKGRTYRKKVKAEASNSQWLVSSKLITDPKSIVLRSLKPAYDEGKSNNNLNWIIYNDQPPEDEGILQNHSKIKAHAKGIVIMNVTNRNGIWLSHSVPRFPPPLGHELHFDENVSKYGQTFMCINFDVKLAGLKIANHLHNMDALIYDSNIGESLFNIIPGLSNLKWGGRRRRKNDTRQAKLAQAIETRDGQELQIFSKSRDLEADLYANWLEHELRTSMYVETWRNGNGNPLNSSCPEHDYQTNNVKELRLFQEKTIFSWPYHKDHSKWAISDKYNDGTVCIADINRMESQFERGGGAICIKCPDCWTIFSSTILELEPCEKKFKLRNLKKADSSR